MFIPASFKKAIKSTFYDKTVEVLETETTVDAEGGVNYNGLQVKNSFLGNVNFSSCKKIQEDYGLNYAVNIAITTNYKANINDLIRYQDKIYNITDCLETDSHYLLIGQIWK